jgi:amyloid beta precursor protein binding protein 1
MKSQSKTYIALQSLYKSKARKDASEVLAIAEDLAGGVSIDPSEVEQFCANAKFVKLINAEKEVPSIDDIVGK